MIVKKIFALILITASMAALSACSDADKSEIDKADIKPIDRLPLKDDNPHSPYNEYKAYSRILDEYEAGSIIKAFEGLTDFFELYTESEHEFELTDIYARLIPRLLAQSNDYPAHFFRMRYEGGTNEQGTNEAEPLSMHDFIEGKLDELGIEYKDGAFRYNYIHYRNIAKSKKHSAVKDDAYYKYIMHQAQTFSNGEFNPDKFYDNLKLVEVFAENFPTSMRMKEMLAENDILPKSNEHIQELSKWRKIEAKDKIHDINDLIDELKTETNFYAYPTGIDVRMRDAIPSIGKSRSKSRYVYILSDYNIVKVHRIKKRYNSYKRKNEYWAIVELETSEGSIFGWTFYELLHPVKEDIPDRSDISEFMEAMKLKERKRYIQAADAFSKFLLENEKSYLTDKAYYQLWEVNTMISALTSSRFSRFAAYVRKFDKYFVYDEQRGIFRSSNLIYEIMKRETPNSHYLFKVNNRFVLD